MGFRALIKHALILMSGMMEASVCFPVLFNYWHIKQDSVCV